MPVEADAEDLHERAYAAFEGGDLAAASTLFAQLLQTNPDWPAYHYMRGLVHKYLRDWPTSLEHNLRAIELHEEPDPASLWNAGIAATALGKWAEVRRLWTDCGIGLPPGEGPVEADFGVVSVRLNPWGDGETLFARRFDVVRARLMNVPLPESGYRYGDVVLHDGARTGERAFGRTNVPVFNALARLSASEFETHAVFVRCEDETDLSALLEIRVPGIGATEDWTESIGHYCLRCSYGAPHRHEETSGWSGERNLGIAAQSRASVVQLLDRWKGGGRGRRVDGIETRTQAPSEPAPGTIWWRGPDEED